MTEMVETKINGRWSLLLPDFRAERVEWSDPGWERERLDSMHANIKPGDVVYDVGSEEGDLSGLYALWGARLVLCEPNERVWSCAKAIWEANKLRFPLAWYQGFVSNRDGYQPDALSIYAGSDTWPVCASDPLIRAHGFSSLAEHSAHADPSVSRITLNTLSDLVGTPPDAITIDVEGAEMLVLEGAYKVLDEHRPLVWVSVHDDMLVNDYGYRSESVHQYMAEHGYRGQFLASDHEIHYLFYPKEIAGDVVLP